MHKTARKPYLQISLLKVFIKVYVCSSLSKRTKYFFQTMTASYKFTDYLSLYIHFILIVVTIHRFLGAYQNFSKEKSRQIYIGLNLCCECLETDHFKVLYSNP